MSLSDMEHAFYKKYSGLPKGSLSDHMSAFFKGGLDSDSIPVGTWQAAWDTKSVATLRTWFSINTGPRIPLTKVINGEVIVTSQEQADALVGATINGHIIVNKPNIELRDFFIMGDGHPILIDHRVGSNGLRIHHVEVNSQYNENTVRCISGPATDIGVEYCNLHHINDGGSGRADSEYRYNWIHTPIVWVGPWVTETDPHTDGIQVVGGSNIIIERNFIDITPSATANVISCVLVKCDDAAIDNVTIQNNYVNGGGRTITVNTGAQGSPTNVSVLNNWMGEDFSFGLWNITGGLTVTRTNNVWATTFTPVSLETPTTWEKPSSARNITADAGANVTSGEIRVARFGDIIELRFKALIIPGAGTVVITTLPPGFLPAMEVNDRIQNSAGATRTLNILRDGKVTVYGAVAADSYNYSVSYRTSDTFPAVLPGTTVYTA